MYNRNLMSNAIKKKIFQFSCTIFCNEREGVSPILVRTNVGLESFRSSQQVVGFFHFHYSPYRNDLLVDFHQSCGLSTMSISQYESRGVR